MHRYKSRSNSLCSFLHDIGMFSTNSGISASDLQAPSETNRATERSPVTLIRRALVNHYNDAHTHGNGSFSSDLRDAEPLIIVLNDRPEWALDAIRDCIPEAQDMVRSIQDSTESEPCMGPVSLANEFRFSIDHVVALPSSVAQDAPRPMQINSTEVICRVRITACIIHRNVAGDRSPVFIISCPKGFCKFPDDWYSRDGSRRWYRLMSESHWLFVDISTIANQWRTVFKGLTEQLSQSSKSVHKSSADLEEIKQLHSLVSISLELSEILRTQKAIVKRIEGFLGKKASPESNECLERICQFVADLDFHHHTITVVKQQFDNLLGLTFNIAAAQQNKVAAQQNKTLGRISLVGFVFVPLSFVASLFGITDLHVNPLYFLCVALPIVLVTTVVIWRLHFAAGRIPSASLPFWSRSSTPPKTPSIEPSTSSKPPKTGQLLPHVVPYFPRVSPQSDYYTATTY